MIPLDHRQKLVRDRVLHFGLESDNSKCVKYEKFSIGYYIHTD